MNNEKNYKKEKQILLELDNVTKDVRSQLSEQLRCLEHQIDSQNLAALELSEYFKKRAELESEYTHGLENLVKSLSQRIKSNSAKKDSLWHSHSTSDLLFDLVQDTKQQAKCHAHFSELCSKHIPDKIVETCDDSRRMLVKCKQVALDCHGELLKTLKEVQSSMRSYHEYQYSSKQAEDKLTTIQQQITKLKSKKLPTKYETRLDKRQIRYSDTKLKAFKARNDYILCIESSNAALSHYFSVDISDLIDCMNFGFHTAIAKCVLMYISGQGNIIRSRQLCVNTLNRSIADLDAVKDKGKFFSQFQSLFTPTKVIKFEAHKGDEVSLIHAQVLLKDEMQQRFRAVEKRMESLSAQHEETFAEIESIEKELMQLINVKNYDVTDLFKDLHFDSSCAKVKRIELENLYIEKFKSYTLTSNMIARLKMKHSLLQKALGQSSTPLAESRIVFRPKKIGKAPVIGRPRLFGGKLTDYIEATGQHIPQIIYSCIRAINRLGLHHQGIFRVSGSQVDINDFKEQFERGEDPLLSVSSRDMNSVAGVLKLYLRELKDPLFPREYFEDLMSIVSYEKDPMSHLSDKLKAIPAPIYVVMRYIFAFLNHLTEYSDENMMDANNIASCFAPTVLPVPEEYEQVKYLSNTIELVRLMVVHHDEILLNNLNEGPLYEKFPTSSSIDEEQDDDEDDDSNFNDEMDEDQSDKLAEHYHHELSARYHPQQHSAQHARRLVRYKKPTTRTNHVHRKSEGGIEVPTLGTKSMSSDAADQKRYGPLTTLGSADETELHSRLVSDADCDAPNVDRANSVVDYSWDSNVFATNSIYDSSTIPEAVVPPRPNQHYRCGSSFAISKNSSFIHYNEHQLDSSIHTNQLKSPFLDSTKTRCPARQTPTMHQHNLFSTQTGTPNNSYAPSFSHLKAPSTCTQETECAEVVECLETSNNKSTLPNISFPPYMAQNPQKSTQLLRKFAKSIATNPDVHTSEPVRRSTNV